MFQNVNAQKEVPITRILFVFDASNSMNARWQTNPKIEVARNLLINTLDELEGKPNLQLGLRIYGHQSSIKDGAQDCNDTKLEVPLGYDNTTWIKKEINGVTCQGTTPIARSLEKAAYDFTDCDNCRNVIILITDGIEACDEDPCAVSRALMEKNIMLKPFIIGIGIDETMISSLECIGNFFDATNEETFATILNVVISQALNSTTAQVNLLNINQKPLETNVPITIYDNRTGEIMYNLVHTLNHKGNPDTLYLDPLYVYDVTAHTLPETRSIGNVITPGIHNVIALETPQGDLMIKMNGRVIDYKNIKAIVRLKDSSETLFAQVLNQKMKYIIGEYDLEILTLPRTYINNVNIEQSHTTTVEIPEPGVLTYRSPTPGYGAIMLEENNELTFVIQLDPNSVHQSFNLQPGRYRLVYRSKGSKESLFSIEKKFEIISGRSTAIEL
jgi:Ca-activated chloride channel family protein